MSETRIFVDASEVADQAAQIFVAEVAAALHARARCIVCLSGGSTPRALYQRLAAPSLRDRVEWRRVDVIFGDERCVAAEHPDSNFRMANDALLGTVAATVHRIFGELAPDVAARAYDAELRQLSGNQLEIDLLLLGMGKDGHTASLFPGSPALQESHRWAVAVQAPIVPAERVTLTLPVLNAARATLVLATGAEKRAALAKAVAGAAPGEEEIPLQYVRPKGPIRFLIDRAAAGELV